MTDRQQKTEVRGDESRASAPAGDKPKQEIRGTAQRDNVKGKTHNSATRKNEEASGA